MDDSAEEIAKLRAENKRLNKECGGIDEQQCANEDKISMLKESNEERRYDQNSINPKGIPEDKTRCIAEVVDFTGWHSFQCSRKRGYGPNGEYCKQHAKKFEEQK